MNKEIIGSSSKLFIALSIIMISLCACATAKLHKQGMMAWKSGDHDDAVRYLREAFLRDPGDEDYFRDYTRAAIEYADLLVTEAEKSKLGTLPGLRKVTASLKPVPTLLSELRNFTSSKRKVSDRNARSELEKMKGMIDALDKRYTALVKKTFPARVAAIRESANKHCLAAITAIDRLQPNEAGRELTAALRLIPSHKRSAETKPFVSVLRRGMKAEKSARPVQALRSYYTIIQKFAHMKELRAHYGALFNLLNTLKADRQRAAQLYAQGHFTESAALYRDVIKQNSEDTFARTGLFLSIYIPHWFVPAKVQNIEIAITKAEEAHKKHPEDPHIGVALKGLRKEQAGRAITKLTRTADQGLKINKPLDAAQAISQAMEVSRTSGVSTEDLKILQEKTLAALLNEVPTLSSGNKFSDAYTYVQAAERLSPHSPQVRKAMTEVRGGKLREVEAKTRAAASGGRIADGIQMFHELEIVGFTSQETNTRISRYIEEAAKESLMLAESYRNRGYPGIALHVMYTMVGSVPKFQDIFKSQFSALYGELASKRPQRVALQVSGAEDSWASLPVKLRRRLVLSAPMKSGSIAMVSPKELQIFTEKYGPISAENVQYFPVESDAMDVVVSIRVEGRPGEIVDEVEDVGKREYIAGIERVPNPEYSKFQESLSRRAGDEASESVSRSLGGGLLGGIVGALAGAATEDAIAPPEYITRDRKEICMFENHRLVSKASAMLSVAIVDVQSRTFVWEDIIHESQEASGRTVRPISGDCSKAGIEPIHEPPKAPGMVEQDVVDAIVEKFSAFLEEKLDRVQYFLSFGKVMSKKGKASSAIEALARAASYSDSHQQSVILAQLGKLNRPSLEELASAPRRGGGRINLGIESRTVVTDLNPQGIKPQLALEITEVLRAHLVGASNLKILAREELSKMMEEFKFQVSDLCGEDCGTKIGLAAGAEKLITGSLALRGKQFQLTLKFIDLGSMQTQAAVSDTCECPEGQLPEFTKRLADRLLGKLSE